MLGELTQGSVWPSEDITSEALGLPGSFLLPLLPFGVRPTWKGDVLPSLSPSVCVRVRARARETARHRVVGGREDPEGHGQEPASSLPALHLPRIRSTFQAAVESPRLPEKAKPSDHSPRALRGWQRSFWGSL